MTTNEKRMKSIANLLTPEEVNSRLTPEQRREKASKAGKASAAAKAERKLLSEEILKRMGAEDWDEIARNLVARAKESDSSLALLRDTIGQKPSEKQEVELSGSVSLESYLAQFDEG